MTKFTKKLVTGIATGALLLNGFMPLAFADTTIKISGNGSDTNNTANVTMNQTRVVVQNNTANITNNVNVDAKTGNNTADDNTGGNVTIKSGNSNVTANVTNEVNSNQASIDCCASGNTTVEIKKNGTESDNTVNLDKNNVTTVFQTNNADVNNDVNVDAKTGNNSAEDNTGGDVKITSGNAKVNTSLSTMANANFAKVGNGLGKGGDLSLGIISNGEESDNTIDLTHSSAVVVSQDNSAYVDNNVNVDAKTGNNEADDNTGGAVEIKSGNADVTAKVDNKVNFNAADIDCGGCLLGKVNATIEGNGTDSDNTIDATLSSDGKIGDLQDDGVFQANGAYLNNNLYDLDAKTGNNEADDNTGNPKGDPKVESGNADVKTDIQNSVNVNQVGDEITWPELNWGGVNLTINLHDLLLSLGLSV
ncbi:MAG: hypothetical protein M1268_02325 [Patescibacteria group bacterium]|nr:hypothetical protein [Patescibacteria group bacterium]